MHKSLKALALLVAMTSAIPAIADNSNEVQPGPVVGTIGGPITQETVTPKEESKLQRLYNFISKHKADIALGAVSAIAIALGVYAIYDSLYVTGPATQKIIAESEEMRRQAEVVIETVKKITELTKDLPKSQQA